MPAAHVPTRGQPRLVCHVKAHDTLDTLCSQEIRRHLRHPVRVPEHRRGRPGRRLQQPAGRRADQPVGLGPQPPLCPAAVRNEASFFTTQLPVPWQPVPDYVWAWKSSISATTPTAIENLTQYDDTPQFWYLTS